MVPHVPLNGNHPTQGTWVQLKPNQTINLALQLFICVRNRTKSFRNRMSCEGVFTGVDLPKIIPRNDDIRTFEFERNKGQGETPSSAPER
ncbi:hypothetical protein JTE90_005744 [Oedothorax gibbosus]|uniref:Uncharacterized protein n=1 Tax=Oedothorax gibbosus TaxID=931172 RepID=A0AAV6UTU6_9ARAC|nr:hypothetical protein JTE90_005744 [Oedothorax gibbosus]